MWINGFVIGYFTALCAVATGYYLNKIFRKLAAGRGQEGGEG